MNENITMDIINTNPDKDWYALYYTYRKKITYENVIDNYERFDICDWNFDCEIDKDDYIEETQKIYKEKYMKKVFEELIEVCLDPDNMELMKKTGVYSDLKQWKLMY